MVKYGAPSPEAFTLTRNALSLVLYAINAFRRKFSAGVAVSFTLTPSSTSPFGAVVTAPSLISVSTVTLEVLRGCVAPSTGTLAAFTTRPLGSVSIATTKRSASFNGSFSFSFVGTKRANVASDFTLGVNCSTGAVVRLLL